MHQADQPSMAAEDELVDFAGTPFEQRTPRQVRDHYHRRYPLLRAADELIEVHNGRLQHSINEPWVSGLTDREITRRALEAIGRPPRDEHDVAMAVSYIDRLRDEMRDMCPAPQPDLVDAIISAEFQSSGCVTTAQEFVAMSEADRQDHVEFLAAELMQRGDVEHHLQELLTAALPMIYIAITEADEARRQTASNR
jgi:hypothetical protein